MAERHGQIILMTDTQAGALRRMINEQARQIGHPEWTDEWTVVPDPEDAVDMIIQWPDGSYTKVYVP